MKNLLVVLSILFFLTPVFAFELPAGKSVDKTAVQNGINAYTRKIESNPQDEDAFFDRAFLFFLIDNIQAAISDYDKLISLNPNNEEYYLNRGYLKHISNKRIEALKDYELALKIKPDYAFAHNNRGVVLDELGRKNDSLQAYNNAIKIDPNYADAYYNRGNLMAKIEKNTEALDDYNTAISLNPTDSASFNNRGVVKRKLKYDVGALSDFSIAIKLNPEDITAFANRGRLKKRYFDSEGAEEDFKAAIAVAEESSSIIKQVETQRQIAVEAKLQMQDSKATSDNIQKISNKTDYIKSESNVKVATVKASVVKVDPKTTKSMDIPVTNISNSEPKIETKPVANPQLAECYYIRALQKYILQKRESALKDFDTAIQYNSNYAEAYYYRAAIKRDFKDEGFVDDYRKAIQLNPALKSVAEEDVLMILKI
jgi:tetratricopeptide (TPR) repeat protein